MFTRILAATLLLGGLTSGAMAADSATTSAPAAAATSTTSTTPTKQSIPQELRQKLTSAGYTDVEIIPSSFLVNAKNKDGNQVMMRISPDSMTMLTEVPVSTTGSAPSAPSAK